MKIESDKRKKYSESRSKNRNICKTYEQHMENENEDEDINELDKGVKFKIPTINEIKVYCNERKNDVDPDKWFNFYKSKGWMVGKNKMKDWKAAIRTWEKKEEKIIIHQTTMRDDIR
jgi:hypothetical protein